MTLSSTRSFVKYWLVVPSDTSSVSLMIVCAVSTHCVPDQTNMAAETVLKYSAPTVDVVGATV